jgi:hypothetical protein
MQSRRQLLAGLGAASLLRPQGAIAAPASEVPADFIGLSFETGELLKNHLLTPDNSSLVSLIRGLGPAGLLRIGGNSSDRATAHPSPASIASLAAFVRAIGWSLVYGLDLGNGSPGQAADEARAAADAAGPALVAFQIGNEPDLFSPDLRPPGWTVADYLAEWQRFAEAVLARVPGARFAGPDIAARGSWMMPFASLARPRPVLLTRHFYTEGPGSSPSVTIARMLGSGPALAAAMAPAEDAARASNLPVRMIETNSVYGGGRPGVSDTLAAAIWGADLMFRLAASGWSGVNFHDRPIRSYAPIGEDPPGHPFARPLYYGMLLFARSHARRVFFLSVPESPGVSAYTVEGRDGRTRLAFINKDPVRTVRVAPPAHVSPTNLLRLTAPSPAATAVTLGGAAVGDGGAWQPSPEPITGLIELPPCNAVLVRPA